MEIKTSRRFRGRFLTSNVRVFHRLVAAMARWKVEEDEKNLLFAAEQQ